MNETFLQVKRASKSLALLGDAQRNEILRAVGEERDPDRACCLNVAHAVEAIRAAFREHPEIPSAELTICGAVYDILSGEVRWLEE